jgi:predicted nucleic acid-binding protein
MTDRIFIDTNIWVYFYAKDPPEKFQKIREIINSDSPEIIVSTQTLGELFYVLTKKKFTSASDAVNIISELGNDFPVVAIDTSKVLQAVKIQLKYGYSYWDCLIIATALLSDCSILYSEDMQHGQLIDNKTQILNPLND